MPPTKIIVSGAAGRMGKTITELALSDTRFALIAGLESEEHTALADSLKQGVSLTADIDSIKRADVIIDFSAPWATVTVMTKAIEYKKAMVIGTTGFNDQQNEEIKTAAKKIPVLLSPNMSIGVNLLFKLVGQAAHGLPEYNAEIVEIHHNKKVDAPSGTAKKLAHILAAALDMNEQSALIYGREGIIGKRPVGEIGVHAVRAGDIVGEHTVYFAGPEERIELTHRAHSRVTFAAGALRAALWIADKKPGLYSMNDVLGI